MRNFLIGEYLAKLQGRAWLSHALCTPGQNGQHTAKRRRDGESARDNHAIACNFAKHSPILIFSLTDLEINLS